MCVHKKPLDAPAPLDALVSRYALHDPGGSPGRVASAPPAAPAATGPRGSARRKLWELGGHAPCPVTGVCLRLPELLKLARKAGLDVAGLSEYETHIAVVSECRRRTELAELVQRELDTRHELFVLKSLKLKTTEALAQWWDQSCMGLDWAGVFWAVLTHPRCTPELEFAVLGQVHMLQHQVGMAARVDLTRLQSLVQDNQKLGDELAITQQRLQAVALELAQIKAQHDTERVRLRGELIRAQSAKEQAETQCDDLKRQTPDLPLRQRLADDNRQLIEHNQQLRRALNRVNDASPAAPEWPAPASPAQASGSPLPVSPDAGWVIHDRSVLCVGGRTRVIPVYRELIEDKGARFLHHDGGEEDKAGQLGPMLQSADLVICQVGCISHNAYWRVKEHCKRHGKPCLFVETPSRSAMERALSGCAAAPDVTPLA